MRIGVMVMKTLGTCSFAEAVDAMLVKPIDAGTLRRTVKNLLAAEEQRKAAEAAPAADATGETPSGPEEQVG